MQRWPLTLLGRAGNAKLGNGVVVGRSGILSERVRRVVPHDDRKDAAVRDVNDHALRRTCAARARGASGLGPDVDFRRRVPGRSGRFPGTGGFRSGC